MDDFKASLFMSGEESRIPFSTWRQWEQGAKTALRLSGVSAMPLLAAEQTMWNDGASPPATLLTDDELNARHIMAYGPS